VFVLASRLLFPRPKTLPANAPSISDNDSNQVAREQLQIAA